MVETTCLQELDGQVRHQVQGLGEHNAALAPILPADLLQGPPTLLLDVEVKPLVLIHNENREMDTKICDKPEEFDERRNYQSYIDGWIHICVALTWSNLCGGNLDIGLRSSNFAVFDGVTVM